MKNRLAVPSTRKYSNLNFSVSNTGPKTHYFSAVVTKDMNLIKVRYYRGE